MTKHNGLSLIEVMISIIALSIIMLAFAEFSANTFKVNYKHSQLLAVASETRFLSERIMSQVQKADYIFPSNLEFNLDITGSSEMANTLNAIFLLIRDSNSSDTSPQYYLSGFYVNDSNEIYEYISDYPVDWTVNTLPYSDFSTSVGTATLIASNIDVDTSDLTYIRNYDNGVTDTILKGTLSGNISSDDSEVLLKGVDWNIKLTEPTEKFTRVKGNSHNVPRFIE